MRRTRRGCRSPSRGSRQGVRTTCKRCKGDVRQPWADGPRTQQCGDAKHSVKAQARGAAGSCKPTRPSRAERRRKLRPWPLPWMPVAMLPRAWRRRRGRSLRPVAPHALSFGLLEETRPACPVAEEHGAMTHVLSRRHARQPVRAKRGPMTGSGGHPVTPVSAIITGALEYWVPAFAGTTVERCLTSECVSADRR